MRGFALLLTLWCGAVSASGMAESDRRAQVQAAYLYNFLLFVHWPGELSEGPVPVCTLGSGAVNHVLPPIEQRTLRGRPIELRLLDDIREARDCRLLFINESEEADLHRALFELGDAPVLTVSDIPRFARRGGIIGFAYADRRIRLEVDLQRARVVGLSISSKLLEVASQVFQWEAVDP